MDELGSPGYTEVDGDSGSAPLRIMIDLLSLYLSFFLTKHRASRIIYGATESGRAVASATTGTDTFRIEVKGHEGG